MKKLILIMATFTAIFFVGCSTTSTIKAHPDYSGNTSTALVVIDKTDSVNVLVSGKIEDKEEIDLLRTELISQFQENGFVLAENNPMATVKVEITNVKRVSRGTRMLLGAFAGKAKMDVEVIIIKNNQTVSMFSMETEAISFTGWGNLPGTTKQAIAKTAERLVKIITNGTLQ